MKKMRQELQIIFQDPFSSLQPRMPVGEIIGEAVREHNLVPKAEFNEYMLINKTLPTKKEIFNHAAHLMDVVGFAARCEHCHERCLQETPVLKEVSPGHLVACHLCDK